MIAACHDCSTASLGCSSCSSGPGAWPSATEDDDFDFAAGFGDASMLPSMAYVMTGLPRQHP